MASNNAVRDTGTKDAFPATLPADAVTTGKPKLPGRVTPVAN